MTRLVGVFGGPDHVVHYRNGDRASYVTTTFEAELDAGSARPDGAEVLEVRFVTHAEAASLKTSPWIPEILDAVFGAAAGRAFRAPTWTPPAIATPERTS